METEKKESVFELVTRPFRPTKVSAFYARIMLLLLPFIAVAELYEGASNVVRAAFYFAVWVWIAELIHMHIKYGGRIAQKEEADG